MAIVGDDLGDAVRVAITQAAESNPADRVAIFRAWGNAFADYMKANVELDNAQLTAGVGTCAGTHTHSTPTNIVTGPVSGGIK